METTTRTVSPDGSFVETLNNTPCSIDLTRSAKGTYNWAIKLYTAPDGLAAAAEEIKRVDALLREQYAGELG